jgi:glycerol kinase
MTQSNKSFLLAIDQGTTSSRAILFNTQGEIQNVCQQELTLSYPQSGWVEQDAEIIWQDTLQVCRDVLQATPNALTDTVAIGITNQRETTVVWDKKTGIPVYNAIVWQDRRTADICEQFIAQGKEAEVTAKTGLLLDPYFAATKIAWILDNVAGARARAEAGQLLFGTIDTFLLWRLTEGRVHATDATNASRSLLLNIATVDWDNELLALFNIPRSMLPEVRDNVSDFGEVAESLLGVALPISAMIGDQQAALVGQACFEKGMIKSTYGTGCFMLMNVGVKPIASQHRLVTTIGYQLNGNTTYALEGSIFIAGAAIQWLRDGLALFEHASASEAMAQSIAGNDGVYFVPALTGLGAPYWRPDIRGAIMGLGRDTSAAHIARAALEAQAYQTRDLVAAMVGDIGDSPAVIRTDGGLIANAFVCQFLADILQTNIEVPAVTEATAWGAASLAGIGAGVFSGIEDIERLWQKQHDYLPSMPVAEADELYAGWQRAVKSLLSE